MSDSTITFLVLGAVVVLFIWDYFPVELVAVSACALAVGDGRAQPDQSSPVSAIRR